MAIEGLKGGRIDDQGRTEGGLVLLMQTLRPAGEAWRGNLSLSKEFFADERPRDWDFLLSSGDCIHRDRHRCNVRGGRHRLGAVAGVSKRGLRAARARAGLGGCAPGNVRPRRLRGRTRPFGRRGRARSRESGKPRRARRRRRPSGGAGRRRSTRGRARRGGACRSSPRPCRARRPRSK